ncbi:Protein CBG27623 [Caenorhabditis briggsae]|uniref:Uncharacterized protein n=2 Tax=Caenorhabditis briggsae TaxID=6238 RepID=A0AAE9JRI3_CAEBR|nr:Protein CBG27623 [Caenorhabditis briggsae]ULT81629.1 hypothetical protein L3Y34_011546 [Caenorhabditis briggsae]UMM40942.1 hypothetical protein L5515_017425 [Caenorhabditis briggsae]CAR99902.1 Protein CBG27623 [Caenorhabditis briggsae]
MFEGISAQNIKDPEAVEVVRYEYDRIKRVHINSLSQYISPHHGTTLFNLSLRDIILVAAEKTAPGTSDAVLLELLQSLGQLSVYEVVDFSNEIQDIEKKVEDFLSTLEVFQKEKQQENATVREMTVEMMRLEAEERDKLNEDLEKVLISTETIKDLCICREVSLMGNRNKEKRRTLYEFTPKVDELLIKLKSLAEVDELTPPRAVRRPVQRKFAKGVVSNKIHTYHEKLLEFLKSEAFMQLGHPYKTITEQVVREFLQIADFLSNYQKSLYQILLNASQAEVDIKMYSRQLSMLHTKSNKDCEKIATEVDKLKPLVLDNVELLAEWIFLQRDITP